MSRIHYSRISRAFVAQLGLNPSISHYCSLCVFGLKEAVRRCGVCNMCDKFVRMNRGIISVAFLYNEKFVLYPQSTQCRDDLAHSYARRTVIATVVCKHGSRLGPGTWEA